MDVDIYIPCLIDQFFPETGFNMIKVLEAAGCTVFYNPEQTCCGMPAMHSGYWDQARAVGEKLIDEYDSDRLIVCAGSACTGMIRNDYEELFENSVWLNKYKSVRERFVDLSEFLIDHLSHDQFGSVLKKKAVYQDACSAIHWCDIDEQPRQLLANVEGLELIDIEDREMCCGFGGTFAAKFDPVASELAKLKVENIMRAGAELIITSEPGCLMHLKKYIKKEEVDLEVLHIADVLSKF
ncbi:MAG: (Fe-S)-binding protein [Bacteroidia bacterium]|nr:(Fe-S)-binding protein [Bacteroidia bacterium]